MEINTVLWSWLLSCIWTQSFNYKFHNNNMNFNVTCSKLCLWLWSSCSLKMKPWYVSSPQAHIKANLLQSVSFLLCIRNPASSVSQRLTGGDPCWYQIVDVKKVAWIQSSLKRHLGRWVGLRRLCVRFVSLGYRPSQSLVDRRNCHFNFYCWRPLVCWLGFGQSQQEVHNQQVQCLW